MIHDYDAGTPPLQLRPIFDEIGGEASHSGPPVHLTSASMEL